MQTDVSLLLDPALARRCRTRTRLEARRPARVPKQRHGRGSGAALRHGSKTLENNRRDWRGSIYEGTLKRKKTNKQIKNLSSARTFSESAVDVNFASIDGRGRGGGMCGGWERWFFSPTSRLRPTARSGRPSGHEQRKEKNKPKIAQP